MMKNANASVVIKGIKNGILVELSESEEWLQVTGELAAQLDAKSTFFTGALVTVELGARPVPKHELTSLKALLDRRGLEIWSIMSRSETTIDAAHTLDLKTNVANTVIIKAEDALDETHPDPQFDSEEAGTPGVMVRRTLRSGQFVNSPGHVVIYGDINPGAQVTAGGDIIVWGRLRGNVHAGANGDDTSVVCALDMRPTQLRISGYIVTSPPDDRRRDARPEVAYITGNQIIVEAWR